MNRTLFFSRQTQLNLLTPSMCCVHNELHKEQTQNKLLHSTHPWACYSELQTPETLQGEEIKFNTSGTEIKHVVTGCNYPINVSEELGICFQYF